MTTFLLSFGFVLIAWWMLSTRLRHLFYSEWLRKPKTTWQYLTDAVALILRQFSVQHNQAMSFVDGELKILNQRQSFLLLSFQRLALWLPVVLIAATLQIYIFMGLLAAATLLLMIFFKKPVKWIQVALLMGLFFMAYQWSFYQANQWIFSQDVSSEVLAFSDTRLFFYFIGASALLTFFVRLEFWSVWFSSLLFLGGGMAFLNAVGLIVGEALGWAVYWLIQSFYSSRRNRIIQREVLLLTVLSAVLYLSLLIYLRTMGLLEIRIMGPLVTRKISYLAGWLGWEFTLTVALSVWGHFRYASNLQDVGEVETIKLPLSLWGRGLLGYKVWVADQLDYRKCEIQRRLTSLQEHHEGSKDLPPALAQKFHQEVESLKHLLGALPSDSV